MKKAAERIQVKACGQWGGHCHCLGEQRGCQPGGGSIQEEKQRMQGMNQGAERTEPADGLITGGVGEEGKKDALTMLHFSKESILNDLIKTDQQQH